jgi:hypothetical protein
MHGFLRRQVEEAVNDLFGSLVVVDLIIDLLGQIL